MRTSYVSKGYGGVCRDDLGFRKRNALRWQGSGAGVMDFFGVVAIVWLCCAAAATLAGRFRGRAGEAMTLGVFLGPAGLLLTLLWIGRTAGRVEPAMAPLRDAQRQPPAGEDSRIELGRAA
jgi:hypothetical protein